MSSGPAWVTHADWLREEKEATGLVLTVPLLPMNAEFLLLLALSHMTNDHPWQLEEATGEEGGGGEGDEEEEEEDSEEEVTDPGLTAAK